MFIHDNREVVRPMKSKDLQTGLFGEELGILESSMADVLDERYKGNDLMPKYQRLIASYKKLINLTSKIFKISDMQGKDLKRREHEIKNILDNSNQGFLTFGKDLLVDRQYSSECIRIFGRKITSLNIVTLLSGENAELGEVFDGAFRKIFNNGNDDLKRTCFEPLPKLININGRYINIKYQIINHIENEMDHDLIMLILTDITEKRRIEDQVSYLSYHDKLTSLYNRAYIDSIIPQLETASQLPLSIIMADINGLKLTNDVFGHEFGDRLLVKFASVFQKSCRKSDIVARWGGDEFLILLPGADETICKIICDKIKIICNEAEPDPIELSVSLGMATMKHNNMSISEIFSLAETMMYSNKLIESKSIRRKIIYSIEKVLHTKGLISHGHNDRVRTMANNFAKYLEIKDNPIEMSNLLLLGRLHDIGKVGIPKEVLNKTGPLTQSEWKIMKNYREIGFRMAQSIEEPILAYGILSMGERWDGGGYPYGLKSEQIPFIARVISIIDAYDVMTNECPYKQKLSKEEAIEEIIKCSGVQFDPRLAQIFVDNINNIETEKEYG